MNQDESGKYVLNSIYDLSPEFLSELKLWIEQAGIAIPVNRLVGFTQFVPQGNKGSGGSTGSTTYTTVGTGPSLSGLPPGKYLLMFGVSASNGASDSRMAVSVNGDTPTDADSAYIVAGATNKFGMSARLVTLTANSNSLAGKFKAVSGGTSSFSDPWLLAVRYA